MSHRLSSVSRLSTSLLVGLPLLAGLAGCDGIDLSAEGPEGVEAAPRPGSAEEAIGRLTADEREQLEAWQGSLLKSCSTADALSGDAIADEDLSLDVAVLESKLDHGRVLAADERIALLDPGEADPFRSSTSRVAETRSLTINGRTERFVRDVTLTREAGVCVVTVDGFELARADLRDAVELRAFYDGAREVKHSGAVLVSPVEGSEDGYSELSPAVWLETAASALEPSREAYPWIADKLGLPRERIEQRVVPQEGRKSHRLVLGEASQSPSMHVPFDADYPWFLSTTPAPFVSATELVVETRYAMASSQGELTAVLRLNLQAERAAEQLGNSYELIAEAREATIAVDAQRPDALGDCVAEHVRLVSAAYGTGGARLPIDAGDLFPSCAGYALAPEATAFSNARGTAALATLLSRDATLNLRSLGGFTSTLARWLELAVMDDASFAGLETGAATSPLLRRLSDVAVLMRRELPTLQSAELLREYLPSAVLERIETALVTQSVLTLDAAQTMETAEALHTLEPEAVTRYLRSYGSSQREAERAEQCMARPPRELSGLASEIRDARSQLSELAEWRQSDAFDVLTPWLFDEGGCQLPDLQRGLAALESARAFVDEDTARGLSYNGESALAELAELGVAERWGASQYAQLEPMAVLFRKDGYCDQTAAAEAIQCSIANFDRLVALLDARYEGRYAELAPELAVHHEALSEHFSEAYALLEHFADPLWGACDARAFGEKRTALTQAVKRVVEADYAQLPEASAAFDGALADCE